MSLEKLLAVVLSHIISVVDCCFPSSFSVRRSIIDFCELTKRDANDASAANKTIGFIIEYSICKAP